MPNIMLTNRCNLGCPYCFANEFVNVDANEITLENFRRALDFIVGDGTQRRVGLIGGEPTLHTRLHELLRVVIDDVRVETATLYTNGLVVEPFVRELMHPKFNVLVNVNGPADVGATRFERIAANIALLVDECYMRDRVTLGINMYKPDFAYDYLLELLVRHGFTRVRTSITVPNVEAGRNMDARGHFLEMKPQVKRFYRELLDRGITPYFDCNKIPSCLIDEADLAEFADLIPRAAEVGASRTGSRSEGGRAMAGLHGPNGLLTRTVQCHPVVDILQDLMAVRCFGLSERTKVPIDRFDGIAELVRYYENTVDAFACQTAYAAECRTCQLREARTCTGGCLAFKMADIERLRAAADELMAKGA